MNYQVEIKQTKINGRGVFALKNFKKGELIEKCPVIPLSAREVAICEPTILEKYFYEWKGKNTGALLAGYGLMYNHSFKPNAEYDFFYDKKVIAYKALRPIKKGEEVVVNYNFYPDKQDPIDFNHPRR